MTGDSLISHELDCGVLAGAIVNGPRHRWRRRSGVGAVDGQPTGRVAARAPGKTAAALERLPQRGTFIPGPLSLAAAGVSTAVSRTSRGLTPSRLGSYGCVPVPATPVVVAGALAVLEVLSGAY